MKNNLEAFEDGDLTPEHLTKIATDLGVTEEEVTSMNRRMAMGGDTSLNVPMGEDGDSQWQDLLGDEGPLQDERSEEHTSELQSLMCISYAVFCLKKKNYNEPTLSYFIYQLLITAQSPQHDISI